MRRRFHPRESALLLVPVLAMGAIGLWMSKRPVEIASLAPRLAVASKLSVPNPATVQQGFDTQIEITAQIENRPPNIPNDWASDIRLIARDTAGRERRVWSMLDPHDETPTPDAMQNFISSNSSRHSTFDMSYRLFLKRASLPLNGETLLMRFDTVAFSGTGASTHEVSPGEIARLRDLPGTLFHSTEIPVRARGEKIALPRVSTDPMFDVLSVKLKSKGKSAEIEWILRIRGALPDPNFTSANIQYRFMEGNRGFGSGVTGAGLIRVKGKRIYRMTLRLDSSSFSPEFGRSSGARYVRGYLIIRERWPKYFKIELPKEMLKGG